MNFSDLTIESARELLTKKQVTAAELTEQSLRTITARDRDIRAFLTVADEVARQRAAAIDSDRELLGQPLGGIPIGIKDVLMTKGIRTTAAAKILSDYVAVYDATVVKRVGTAGAVVIGKTNCDEFAMGSSTENSAFGPTKNPWDMTRVPGGSSGGSAAAVASGEVLAALGTDTGGSIRQPAAFCGVVGLKPTYGLVSRYGLIAMASSLDCVGSFTKTVKDAAIMLSCLAGSDPRDATTQAAKSHDYEAACRPEIKGMKIGLPREYFVSGLDPAIQRLIDEQVAGLRAAGAEIMEVSLPHTEYALPVYYILMPAEVSSNLAKFDGLRYGGRTTGADNLMDYYRRTRGMGFGAESRRRILIGTYVLSAGYVDEYYVQAQKVRTKIIQDFTDVFSRVDVLLTPTTPTTAFRLGEKSDDPLAMYLSDIYTVSVNLAGLPGLSVPVGVAENLPVGLQLIGRRFGERDLFRVGSFIEQQRGQWSLPIGS